MVGVRASGRQPARGSSLAIDRIARRAYIATEIEHRLEMAGVRLVVADEPAMPASGGRKAETAPQRVHEALVSLETFVQAQEISAHRERSRSTPGLSPDPQAKRVYPLRSFILCDLCGRRMFGNTRRETVSYACNPKKASRPLSTRSPRGSEKITCSAA